MPDEKQNDSVPDEYGFTYKDEGGGRSFVVTHRPNAKADPVVLGTIHKSWDKDAWYVRELGGRLVERNRPSGSNTLLPTRQLAAATLLTIHKFVQANPLPDEAVEFLQCQGDKLQDEYKEAYSRFMVLQRKRAHLSHLAKKYGLSGYQFEFDGDPVKEAQDLYEFLDRENDVIYKKLGKDWGRTIRGLVQSLIATVDPATSINV